MPCWRKNKTLYLLLMGRYHLKAARIELIETSDAPVLVTKKKYPHRPLNMKQKDALWAYGLIAPLMIGLFIFYLWPIFQTIYFSFTNWGFFGGYSWDGMANYQQMLTDPVLGRALWNTFVYTVLSVAGGVSLSLLVAVLLN